MFPKGWESFVRGREIVVWGTGKESLRAVGVIASKGLALSFFVSRDWFVKPSYMRVFSKEVLDKQKHFVVIGTGVFYSEEIRMELKQMGFENEVDFIAPPDFSEAYEILRKPKIIYDGPYPSDGRVSFFLEQMHKYEITVADYICKKETYENYISKAHYDSRYKDWFEEKSLEHFVASELLSFNPGEIYIDIASQSSPVPDIYERLFGVTSYKQDLVYPPGLENNTIGGDASAMPVDNEFADKMALHCAFEHFQGDSDIRFIKEAARVLKPGGKLCILPLYTYKTYSIFTDPSVAAWNDIKFEEGALLSCFKCWYIEHARLYDAENFIKRIHKTANESGLDTTIYKILDTNAISPKCYLQLALLFTKI